MNLRRTCNCLGISSTLLLTACFGGGPILDFSNISIATISVSPRPVSLAVGATQTFTATTTNAGTAVPTWSLNDLNTSAGGAGVLSAASGTTITYTAPTTPPIYAAGLFQSTPQGTVVLSANIQSSAGTTGSSTTVVFVITAPAVTVGLSPTTASVALGGTAALTGYAVGNINSLLTWQVNGVTGGSTANGTITATGTSVLYTAPTAMPMSGPTVTITVLSQADPTKTQTAVITLH